MVKKTTNQDSLQENQGSPEILDGIRPTYNPDKIREICDKIDQNYNYLKQLPPEEILEERDKLIELATRVSSLETEKKTLLTEIKSRLDPAKDDYKTSLEIVRSNKKPVNEEVYIFFKRKQRIAEIYNSEGIFINTRPLTLDELQTNINFNEPND